jgi:hypothetical protein
MSGDGRAVQRAARWTGLISAVTIGTLLVVILVYIVYVYSLWTQAMRAEGPIGAPPP